MKLIISWVGANLLMVLAGCATTATVAQSPVVEIEAASKEYESATRAQDADRIAALLTDSAVIMPADAPTVYGAAAFRTMLRQFSGQLELQEYRVTSREIEAVNGLGVESGTYTQTIKFGNMPARTFDTRYVYIWRRQRGGEWRIARAIFSHPAPLSR